MVPESSLIPKWLRRNGHETTTRSGDSKYPNIKEFNSGDRNCTYKCFVFVRLSSPGFVPSNTGSPPESLLSARSNQYSFESLPSDVGMEPLNLFEFIDLQAWNTMTNLSFFPHHSGSEGKKSYYTEPKCINAVRISSQVQYWLDEHTTELKVEDLLS